MRFMVDMEDGEVKVDLRLDCLDILLPGLFATFAPLVFLTIKTLPQVATKLG
jgi:hypothetical protein